MAVTQYIGARYVPLFADPLQWDNARTYEPLTIVQHQGNSYTSRQSVPIGIDITNESYWSQTGNYNAQIEQYRQEVQSFDARITKNASDITTANDSIAAETTRATAKETELQEGISDVRSTATTNKSDIASLETTVDKLSLTDINSNGEAVFIGDSMSKGTGVSNQTRRITSTICSMLNLVEHNYAVGNSGFVDMGDGGTNNFTNQVNTAANDLGDKCDDIKYVFIIGGYNDTNEPTATWTTENTNAANCLKLAAEKFPNAQLVVVPMLYRCYNFTDNALSLYDAIYRACVNNKLRLTFIPVAWSWTLGNPSFYASDNIHPSDYGSEMIASCIVTHLQGGSATFGRAQQSVFEYSPVSISDDDPMKITFQILGPYVTMKVNEFTVTQDISFPNNLKITDLPQAYCPDETIFVQCVDGNGNPAFSVSANRTGTLYFHVNEKTHGAGRYQGGTVTYLLAGHNE